MQYGSIRSVYLTTPLNLVRLHEYPSRSCHLLLLLDGGSPNYIVSRWKSIYLSGSGCSAAHTHTSSEVEHGTDKGSVDTDLCKYALSTAMREPTRRAQHGWNRTALISESDSLTERPGPGTSIVRQLGCFKQKDARWTLAAEATVMLIMRSRGGLKH